MMAENKMTIDVAEARDTMALWMKDYGPLVLSVCVKVLRNYESALDTSQNVWEIVVRNYGSYRGESQPGTWIYSIAYREALRVAKKEKSRRYRDLLRSYHDETGQPRTDPGRFDESGMYGWLSEKCNNCLSGVIRTLNFRMRMIFVFRYLLDLPFEEIARILDMNEDAVRQAASRSRKRLADFLENECGIFRRGTACRCGLEGYLGQTSFRNDMLALTTITQKAQKLHALGAPLPPIGYWEKIREKCHKRNATSL